MFRLARNLNLNLIFRSSVVYRPNIKGRYVQCLHDLQKYYCSSNDDNNNIIPNIKNSTDASIPKNNIWVIQHMTTDNIKNNITNNITNNSENSENIEKQKRPVNYFERDNDNLFVRRGCSFFPYMYIDHLLFIIHDKLGKRVYFLDEFVPHLNSYYEPDNGSSTQEKLLKEFYDVSSYDNCLSDEKLFRCGPIIFNKTKFDKIILLYCGYSSDKTKNYLRIVYHIPCGFQDFYLELLENDSNEIHKFALTAKRQKN